MTADQPTNEVPSPELFQESAAVVKGFSVAVLPLGRSFELKSVHSIILGRASWRTPLDRHALGHGKTLELRPKRTGTLFQQLVEALGNVDGVE